MIRYHLIALYFLSCFDLEFSNIFGSVSHICCVFYINFVCISFSLSINWFALSLHFSFYLHDKVCWDTIFYSILKKFMLLWWREKWKQWTLSMNNHRNDQCSENHKNFTMGKIARLIFLYLILFKVNEIKCSISVDIACINYIDKNGQTKQEKKKMKPKWKNDEGTVTNGEIKHVCNV